MVGSDRNYHIGMGNQKTKEVVEMVHHYRQHVDRGKDKVERIPLVDVLPIQVGIHQIHWFVDLVVDLRLFHLGTRYVEDARLRSWVLQQSLLAFAVHVQPSC